MLDRTAATLTGKTAVVTGGGGGIGRGIAEAFATHIHLDGGALAAGGFYRAPDGRWTNMPVVAGAGVG